jgi:transcriptional regulator of aromatic amino acid metabolism
VNLRIIAASSRDMTAEVHAQQFRADLYYRLNVGRIVFLSWQAVASHDSAKVRQAIRSQRAIRDWSRAADSDDVLYRFASRGCVLDGEKALIRMLAFSKESLPVEQSHTILSPWEQCSGGQS